MAEFYRRWLSPLVHSISGFSGACRFQPTCSEYAVLAIAHHGAVTGCALALWRVLRCQPFARGGFDPVPGTYRAGAAATSASSTRTDDPLHLP